MALEDYNAFIQKLIEIERQFEVASALYNDRKLSSAIATSERGIKYIEEVKAGCSTETQSMIELSNPRFKLNEFFDGYILEFNHYRGICYGQLGQFHNAVKILSSFINDKDVNRNNKYYYTSLTHFVELSQKIPLDGKIVIKAHLDVELFLNQNGKLHWRHELLLIKSRYEILKGNFENAYYIAKESLALAILSYNREDTIAGQVWDFHFDGLISICLGLNKIREAKNYITQWSDSKNQMPTNRLIRMNKCLAEIARFEGNYNDAYRYASIAVGYSEDTDYEETKFACLCSLLNTLINLNLGIEVEKYLTNLYKLENSERLFIKYHIYLISFKWFGHVGGVNEKLINAKSLLLDVGNELDSLLSLQYYTLDLLNNIKTIVY